MSLSLSRMQLYGMLLALIFSVALSFHTRAIGRNAFARPSSMLSMSSTGKTPLVANGKRFEADPGSSLIVAVQKLGLKVPTLCKKGECGTCTTTVGGVKIRACIGKVPPAPRLKSLIEKGLAVVVDNAR